jgi:hypothetical protein
VDRRERSSALPSFKDDLCSNRRTGLIARLKERIGANNRHDSSECLRDILKLLKTQPNITLRNSCGINGLASGIR